MLEAIYLSLGIALAIYYAIIMGANDAANSSSQPVGSGVMSLKSALTTFGIAATIGALVQGRMVMITVGKGVVEPISALDALLASIAAVLWITLATWLKLPISTSHTIVSSVLGIGIAKTILGTSNELTIRWSLVEKIILSWVCSPAASIALAYLLYQFFKRLAIYMMHQGWNVGKIFSAIVIASHLWGAYSFGANDIANATGVYVTVASRVLGLPSQTAMTVLAAIGGGAIALGGFWWGHRVIGVVGFRITRLDYITAASAILSYAAIVWLFTTIPKLLIGYGMPISTTYVAVSSIVGAGIAAYGFRGISWKLFLMIFLGWTLTLPIACGLSTGIQVLTYKFLPSEYIR
ncbi:MAG: hypothetical protein B6V02_02195 [Thermoprotei archaeon ex4572_64]|nr:MAG: hypothetical protein B6V02_02195 [Thermoprotei archaeon ex4572_64]